MERRLIPALSIAAWGAVWVFWLVVTRGFHPTLAHALVVTTSLVVAYATAASLNHLVLIPALWAVGHRWGYVAALAGMMAALTGIALAVIRWAYFAWSGPDPDPNGVWKHYAIDLFGMAVHLVVAAGVVAAGRRILRPAGGGKGRGKAAVGTLPAHEVTP